MKAFCTYHDVMYVHALFSAHAVLFLTLMTLMTLALVLGTSIGEDSEYLSDVDILRGVLEGLTLLLITYNLYSALQQLAV